MNSRCDPNKECQPGLHSKTVSQKTKEKVNMAPSIYLEKKIIISVRFPTSLNIQNHLCMN